MPTPLLDLLPILALGKRLDGCNPRYEAVVRAIRNMPKSGTRTVGYLGGLDAFVTVDQVAGKMARLPYIKTVFPKASAVVRCDIHGLSEVTVGHIWPRALGGIILKGQNVNIRLECKQCNEEKYSLLTPAQVAYARRLLVPYEW